MINTYLIQHKIKTLAELDVNFNGKDWPKMNIDGFLFYQWEFSIALGWLGDAWLVEKEIQALSAEEAIRLFRSGLDKIVPKIAFVSQCFMDFYSEPFFIKKVNEDNDICFFRYTEDCKGVPLMFQDDELSSYNKLSKSDIIPFRYLQESNNCPSYIPRLILLFSALEALCGKEEKTDDNGISYITYNHKTMKIILGNDLYGRIFGFNGIRHKLNHGDILDFVFQEDYADIIYKKIISYLNTSYNININEDVVSPQRNFYGNNNFGNFWIRPENGVYIDLRYCLDNFNRENLHINKCEIISPIINY